MLDENAFIYEESRYRKIFTVLIFACVLVLAGFVLATNWSVFSAFVGSSPLASKILNFFYDDIEQFNTLGIFYITFLGDLFFNPLPPELFFYNALIKGTSPILLLFAASMVGMLLANIVNYFLGRKFSVFFLYFVSKKNLYRVRRKVNRYGGYAVLVFNIFPLPAPLLTFGLGITRYNHSRLFMMLIIGNVIKYGFLIFSYLFLT